MTQFESATAMVRNRDLFVHDGARLRRIRLTVPVQAALLAMFIGLIAWSGYAAARLAAPATTGDIATLTAATEARARQIEQRQAIVTAMLAGENLDPSLAAASAQATGTTPAGTLARVEATQVVQVAAAARALDARYQTAAAELQKLGLSPTRFTGTGGPFEAVRQADPTFKALFQSWKKLDNLQDGAIAVPSDKPVKTAAFTSGYGVRSDPFQGRAAMHAGIDLSGPVGTPIYATADGLVTTAEFNSGGYGNLIKLTHGRGIETRYGHLASMRVKAGQHVKRGDIIGRMGSTGRSTGSHLHYEVRVDGRAVNPIPFMKSTDYLIAMQRKAGNASMDQVALGGPTGTARK